MWSDLTLTLINFFTSTLTGITGLGGGMILLALMPAFVAPAALIPVHGVTQLASNASRAWFGRDHIDRRYLLPFIAGSLVGTLVFAWLVRFVRLDYVPLCIGIYILLTLWSSTFNRLLRRVENFYLVGFFQTGISTFVGAVGPLAVALLHKHCEDNHTVVSTAAVMTMITHLTKLAIFASIGFQFGAYWPLMLMMIVAATLGSYAGTRLRHFFQPRHLKALLQVLLTVLALQLVFTTVWQHWLAP